MKLTTVGIDLAKNVFQVHGIDEHGPDGHPKLLHLWPVKLLQAGRSDYDDSGVMAMRGESLDAVCYVGDRSPT